MKASPLQVIAAAGACRSLGAAREDVQHTVEHLADTLSGTPGAHRPAPSPGRNWLPAIRAAAQGRRHAQDGLAFLQAAASTLDEMTILLDRANTLAQTALSFDVSEIERNHQDAAFQSLLDGLGQVLVRADFNGEPLFTSVPLQIPLGKAGILEISLGSFVAGLSGDLKSAPGTRAVLQGILEDRNAIAQVRADLEGNTLRLTALADALGVEVENLSVAQSQVRDAFLANEVLNLAKLQILNQRDTSPLRHAVGDGGEIFDLIR